MAQAPRSLDPGRSARHQFGAELRRLRLARGLSQAGLARLVHVSPDLVAKVEKAERWP
ncbi:MAG: helix-turn-helix domain-containing protein, partial [Micromonosporaceae bacterium]|nr:helix-turn-helix domain-containing protein [Micromonosporaceae bacterium]